MLPVLVRPSSYKREASLRSGVAITLDTHSHAIPAMREEAAALIAGLVLAEEQAASQAQTGPPPVTRAGSGHVFVDARGHGFARLDLDSGRRRRATTREAQPEGLHARRRLEEEETGAVSRHPSAPGGRCGVDCGAGVRRPPGIKVGECSACRRDQGGFCLLYTSPSPRDRTRSRMPSSA